VGKTGVISTAGGLLQAYKNKPFTMGVRGARGEILFGLKKITYSVGCGEKSFFGLSSFSLWEKVGMRGGVK
jgi:hypothetical protein